MRTLLIDNYDSFTFNLFQLLAEANGVEPTVVRNDEAEWEELAMGGFDAIVLSPGPGRPERRRDFGVCAEAIARSELPLLGVCLGHQGLGWVHGAEVERAPQALHGRVRPVDHAGSPLFAGIPQRFEAVRYHSLCLARPLPPELEAIAWGEDGLTMAIAHRTRPQWGVQFHPESIAAEYGRRLLTNFRDLASRTPSRHSSSPSPPNGNSPSRRSFPTAQQNEPRDRKQPEEDASDEKLELRRRRLKPDAGRSAAGTAAAFTALYGDSEVAFWLDAGLVEGGPRFTYMGDASGPHATTVFYDVAAQRVTVQRGPDRRPETHEETIFGYLDRELERLRPLAADLPFEFDCGFVGFLGYELKADCGGAHAHRSPLPDAALVLADRMVVFDHESGDVHLLCLVDEHGGAAAQAWLDATEAALAGLDREQAATAFVAGSVVASNGRTQARQGFTPARSRERYLADIAACEERLLEGESYEVCLTNSFAAEVEVDPLELYCRLRRRNPAPHASYLRFEELAVLSSSPERFLRVDRDGRVEAKPIKGTARRDDSPAEDTRLAAALLASEKNRAENLMIVDLLRNDLGSVCEVGSVRVPALMALESYATVHQLVSTVSGRLRSGRSAVQCVRACFPPGSMTGAPKLRTVEILDELEGRARGVYSGAIGFFGLGGGCDLSVAIRTIVLDGETATIGAGGAIVLQSDPGLEYEEMLLKAAASMQAMEPVDAASISLLRPRPAVAPAAPATAPT